MDFLIEHIFDLLDFHKTAAHNITKKKKAPSLKLSCLSTKDIKYVPLFFQHDEQSKELLQR